MKAQSLLKQLKHYLRPRWTKTLRQVLASRFKLMRVANRFGLRPINGNPLGAIKKSDTLFILGSGASINTLSEEEWQAIRAADSAGFNFWPIHAHIPSLYVVEVCAVPLGQEENYRRYCELMRLRSDAYGNTPILIKDGERVEAQWLAEYVGNFPQILWPNISLAWDWEIPGDEESALVERIRRWESCGLIMGQAAPLVRKRATVSYIVLLALRAGYRNIVLCGVDLDNNDYFYRLREAEYAAQGLPVPLTVFAPEVPSIHKTDNVDMGMPISRVLEIINRELLQPCGIHLSVALKSSKLHPMLPSYFGH